MYFPFSSGFVRHTCSTYKNIRGGICKLLHISIASSSASTVFQAAVWYKIWGIKAQIYFGSHMTVGRPVVCH